MIPKNVIKVADILAHKSEYRFRLGAVIFDGKNIYGGGFNDNKKTHPKSNVPFKTIHAEFSAIVSCRNTTVRGKSIYIHRVKKDSSTGLAKPCEHCTSMLKHLGLKSVYYSTESGVERYDI